MVFSLLSTQVEVTMMRQVIKNGVYISSFITFIYYSSLAAIEFIKGEIIYDIVNDHDAEPGFPSITLCPSYRRSLVHLNTMKMKSDFGLNESTIKSVNIFGTLAASKNTTFQSR